MRAFAFPVPLRIIAERLGIPDDDREFFDAAAASAAGGLRLSPLTPEAMVQRAELGLDLQRLLMRLIEARRAEPRDDMITILATSRLEEADRPLTHGECLSILNQFLVAGHETTTSTFGWGMLLLARHPELQQRIRGNPARIRTFVEETLRVESPVQGLPRLVTRDTDLGGYPLKAGTMIMMRYGAANRDERQFDRPDLVDMNGRRPACSSRSARRAPLHRRAARAAGTEPRIRGAARAHARHFPVENSSRAGGGTELHPAQRAGAAHRVRAAQVIAECGLVGQ